MSPSLGDDNYDTFRDCLSAAVLSQYHAVGGDGSAANKKMRDRQRRLRRQRGRKAAAAATTTAAAEKSLELIMANVDDGGVISDGAVEAEDDSELEEFIEFLSEEIFLALPTEARTLCYSAPRQAGASRRMLAEQYVSPLAMSTLEELVQVIPASVGDTLAAYTLISPPKTDLLTFLTPVLNGYVSAATAAPPAWHSTRAAMCEMCGRDWIPLSYHHLIPKAVHAKVLKRGWHEEHMLNKVAWLCRACHSFVHRMASNETLAREWHSMERILEREDVQRWRQWVRNVRWKKM